MSTDEDRIIIEHLLRYHSADNFSVRKRVLDETTGKLCYQSKHFNVSCEELSKYEKISMNFER
jgi:hypothetical protein